MKTDPTKCRVFKNNIILVANCIILLYVENVNSFCINNSFYLLFNCLTIKKGVTIIFKAKLIELGIPADIDGFTYLNEAIQKYKPLTPTGKLVEEVANKFNKTYSQVERSLRTAILKSNDKMTVGQFIAKYSVLWK